MAGQGTLVPELLRQAPGIDTIIFPVGGGGLASGCSIEFLAPAREGDELTARARERSAAGRTGVYDIEVANQRGEAIALFRGKSYRIKGHVIDPS